MKKQYHLILLILVIIFGCNTSIVVVLTWCVDRGHQHNEQGLSGPFKQESTAALHQPA